MITTTIFPGRYIQGSGALKRFKQDIARFGTKGTMLCTPYFKKNILPEYKPEFSDIELKYATFGGECTDQEINRQLVGCNEPEFIIGVGGGKTIDTAKVLAHELEVPLIIIPTIASSDAPCSSSAVVYKESGGIDRVITLRKNPDLVIVDTKIIVKAPTRFLIAGMGDALATWFEAEPCKLKYVENSLIGGDRGSVTAYSLARLCYDILLEYGVTAVQSCDLNLITPAFEHVVEANTLLSTLGFENGGLGAAHAILMGLSILKETHDNYYHGELVAIGLLSSLFLTDKPKKIIDEVYNFCESVRLPTTLSDIGLAGMGDDVLKEVAEESCRMEFMNNEVIPVTPEGVLAAIKMADLEGSNRK